MTMKRDASSGISEAARMEAWRHGGMQRRLGLNIVGYHYIILRIVTIGIDADYKVNGKNTLPYTYHQLKVSHMKFIYF